MKQSEMAKKLGISIRSLQKMSAQALAVHGWEKIGKGKGTYYRRLNQDLSEESERESIEEAKRRKMIADANFVEMKGDLRANDLRREGALQYLDRVMEVLAVLPQAYAAAKLNSEQSAVIREAYETALKSANELRNLA